MRKLLIISATIFLGNFTMYCQDVVNPYYIFPEPIFGYLLMPKYSVQSSGIEFNSWEANIGGSYSGEYMIDFNEFPWFKSYNNISGGINPKWDNAKSYSIETIGFPFAMSCMFDASGCADNGTVRELYMPSQTYSNNQWGQNLWRYQFFNTPIPQVYSQQADIASYYFKTNNPVTFTNIPCYPHSTHRITVYLHCGNSHLDDIVDSVVFVYDNTRGRMRYYPFLSSNNSTIGYSNNWDVVFRPRLIYNYIIGHAYFRTSTNDIYINGNTLNYYPYPSNYSCEFIDPSTDYMFGSPSGTFNAAKIAPFSLTSFLLYEGYNSEKLAGYEYLNQNSTGNQEPLILKDGIKHNYFIDQNIDLNIINPAEKIIYNPSEVSITANDLLFPAGYTFKTIRGMYPSVSEVMADDLAENGGPFADQRDVPVRTDLRSENSNDPNDPNNISHSVYAGRYYLMGNSKLTIENCVKL